MSLLSVVLDIMVVVVLLIISAQSIRRGIVASIVDFVGMIVAIIASAFFASFAAEFIYISFIQNSILNTISGAVVSGGNSSAVFNSLPSYVQNELFLQGINESNILMQSHGINSAGAVEALVRPIVTLFVTNIITVIIFTIIIVIIIAATTKLPKKARLTELDAPEKFVCCIFGIFKAQLFMMIVIIMIDAIVMLLSQNAKAAFDRAVDQTFLYKFLNNVNLPSLIIKLTTGM